jgi:GntR family transcriptional regulator
MYIYIIYNLGDKMNIIISSDSKTPIYKQIVKQIKDGIISGEIIENEKIPSMRTLAKELQISIITTKRAYEELEKEDLIYTKTGQGSFVSKRDISLLKEMRLNEIKDYLKKVYELSNSIDLSLDEVKEMFELIFRGGKDE